MVSSCNMNPRKKFKPRNSNSNSENELPAVIQGHLVSTDRHLSSAKSSPGKQSPPKQRQNNCVKNSPRKNNNLQRDSPQKYHPAPNAVKRQLHYNSNVLSESKQQPSDTNVNKTRRSPRKNSPTACPKQPEGFASPKLSFNSPNAADVPLPPMHWFSGCGRQFLSERNISDQLKTLLNVV